MLKKIAIGFAALIGLLLIGGGVYVTYLGYFSDDPFTVMRPPEGAQKPDYAIAFLSGDMGFNAGMGPQIAKRFVNDGVPVLGFNSLSWFRHRRTPEEVNAIVRDITRRTMRDFGVEKVVLIGQSFGADALHLGLPAMPQALRRHVAFVGLVVPTDTVFLKASPAEIFNWSPPDLPAAPSARELTWVPGVCIHGETEDHSLCSVMTQPNIAHVALPGGHYLDKDSEAVYRALSNAIAQRARGL